MTKPKAKHKLTEYDPNAPDSLAVPDVSFAQVFKSDNQIVERDPHTGQIVKVEGAGRVKNRTEAARIAFSPHVQDAVNRIVDLMHSPNARVALAAAQEVLLRTWGKPPIEVDSRSVKMNVDVKTDPLALDKLLVMDLGGTPLVGDPDAIEARLTSLEAEIAAKRQAMRLSAPGMIDVTALAVEVDAEDEQAKTELLDEGENVDEEAYSEDTE